MLEIKEWLCCKISRSCSHVLRHKWNRRPTYSHKIFDQLKKMSLIIISLIKLLLWSFTGRNWTGTRKKMGRMILCGSFHFTHEPGQAPGLILHCSFPVPLSVKTPLLLSHFVSNKLIKISQNLIL